MSRPAYRFTDLAIKTLIRHQKMRVAHMLPRAPRLAAVASEHVGLAIAATGLYEADEIELVRSIIEQHGLSDTVLLDIGANIGNHACALAPSVRRLIAFEPNPPIAALLRANALLNDLSQVTVHEVGLAEMDAELPFGVAEQGNDGSGSFAAGIASKTLPVRNGDAFLAAHEPGLAAGERIGFIKCDVQGFERGVFAGLSRTLAAHRPIIMFESENQAEGMASWQVLQACGYAHIAQIRAPGDGAGKLARELTRMWQGTACRLEPIAAIPDRHCNLLVSEKPLALA